MPEGQSPYTIPKSPDMGADLSPGGDWRMEWESVKRGVFYLIFLGIVFGSCGGTIYLLEVANKIP